jgi:hypothetical protein
MPNLTIFGAPSQDNYSTIYDTPATTGAYVDSMMKISGMDSPLTFGIESIYKPSDGGLKFTKQEADEISEKEGVLVKVPDDGIDADAFYYNLFRQKQRAEYQQVAERKPDGAVSSVLGVGSSLAVQVVDPINAATAFIPVVGPTRYANMVKAAASPLGRAGVRAGVGAAEGAFGAAIIEPLNYIAAQSLGDDYGAYNSFMNIAFGAGFGGSISSGVGAIADKFGMDAFAIKSLPMETKAQVLQAVSQRLARDGMVDATDIINAATRKHLLYDINQINTIPELRAAASSGRAFTLPTRKALDDIQSVIENSNVKISQLEADLAKGKKLNAYEHALNDYNDAQFMKVENEADQAVKEKRLGYIGKRWGKEFLDEANDYVAYTKLQEELSVKTNARGVKKLQKQADELNAKYDGRLQKAYEQRDAFDPAAAQAELDTLRAGVNDAVMRRTVAAKNEEALNYIKASDEFSRGRDTSEIVKASNAAAEIDRQLAEIKPDNIDSRSAELDEEIAFLKEANKEYEELLKDVDFGDIDDAEFDMSGIVDSAKNYARCLLR